MVCDQGDVYLITHCVFKYHYYGIDFGLFTYYFYIVIDTSFNGTPPNHTRQHYPLKRFSILLNSISWL